MNCAFCASEMKEIKQNQVLIDVCPQCGGHFFDADELGDFIQCKVTEKKMLVTSHSTVDMAPEMNCPRCQSRTCHVVQQAVPKDIEFECCLSCGGMSFSGDSIALISRLTIKRETPAGPGDEHLDGVIIAGEVALTVLDTTTILPDNSEDLLEGSEIALDGVEVVLEGAADMGEVLLEGAGTVIGGLFELIGELLN